MNQVQQTFSHTIKYDKLTFLEKFGYFGSFFFTYFICNTFSVFGIILIDSCIKSPQLLWNGSVQVANIGEITPYYLIAGQILLTLAISMIFILVKKSYFKDQNNVFALLIITSLSIGFVLMLLFMLFAWLYQWYLASGNYVVMHYVRIAGSYFLFSFAPIIIVDAINIALSCLLLHHKGPTYLIVFYFLKTIVSLVFAYLLCCYTKLNLYGFIIGFLLGSLPLTLSNFLYVQIKIYPFKWKLITKDLKFMVHNLLMYSFKDIWPHILKALIVIVIAYTLYHYKSPTLSGFYYSRINWYMFLYLLPMFTASAHLTFQVIKNINSTLNNFFVNKDLKKYFDVIYFAMFLVTIVLIIGFYFSMEPLSSFYIRNLPNSFLNSFNVISYQLTGAGIAYFLVLPNSLSYIFVSLYVFLMALGNYFGDRMQFYIPKGENKVTLKGVFFSILSTIVVTGFIVGLGMGLMNKAWVFAYMSSYSFSMVVVAIVIFLLNVIFYFKVKNKVLKAMAWRKIKQIHIY